MIMQLNTLLSENNSVDPLQVSDVLLRIPTDSRKTGQNYG
jgi:hypothetical protein